MKDLFTITLLTLLCSFQALGNGQLIAEPINSPVKESYLNVKLERLKDISSVYFKPKNGNAEFQGELVKEGSLQIGRLKVSTLKPGSYEYRIRVRSNSGSSPQNEAASVSFITFTIDPSLEVPDPGDEGKKTLQGIDSDGDGIRDDIQRYLNESYSNKPNTKAALSQYAKASQNILSTINNKQENIEAIRTSLNASNCLFGVEGSASNAYPLLKQLQGKILNTKERLLANKHSELNFSGQTILPAKNRLSHCDFETK